MWPSKRSFHSASTIFDPQLINNNNDDDNNGIYMYIIIIDITLLCGRFE